MDPFIIATSPQQVCYWEGMDKSTFVHIRIQIIIIHFLPSLITLIPNR
jgi:hypothetical protein